MVKTFVAIVRDHSGSMRNLAKGATNDYNLMVEGLRNSQDSNHQIYLSVVECGVGYSGKVVDREVNVHIDLVRPLTSYTTDGGSTPLLDSVGRAIDTLVRTTNIHNYNKNIVEDGVAYLVLVITDGHENSSKGWTKSSLERKIIDLQNTDKWTFAFRGPVGSKATLRALGVHEGNILEWEQTEASLVRSTEATTAGIKTFMAARAKGETSQKGFYQTDMSKISVETIKTVALDITNTVMVRNVPFIDNGIAIKDFCIKTVGYYESGRAYYQLTKAEKAVQDYKQIAIRDRKTGKIYAGNVRGMLGLPLYGNIQLIPGNHGQYDLFIQSNSVNRKLIGGTTVLYR